MGGASTGSVYLKITSSFGCMWNQNKTEPPSQASSNLSEDKSRIRPVACNVKPLQSQTANNSTLSLFHLINKLTASKRDNSIYLITREKFGKEQADHLAQS